MKIDKSKLQAMAALSDEDLWKEIQFAAKSKGLSLPEKSPSPSELQKVRDALSDVDKLKLSTAVKLINDLKRGDK